MSRNGERLILSVRIPLVSLVLFSARGKQRRDLEHEPRRYRLHFLSLSLSVLFRFSLPKNSRRRLTPAVLSLSLFASRVKGHTRKAETPPLSRSRRQKRISRCSVDCCVSVDKKSLFSRYTLLFSLTPRVVQNVFVSTSGEERPRACDSRETKEREKEKEK